MSAEELISIHAPSMGSDPCGGRYTRILRNFNPRPPAWGATKWTPVLSPAYTFQSTLPVGGTTLRFVFTDVFSNISIHAPCMGSDAESLVYLDAKENFNPRSPHGERLFLFDLF